MPRRVAPMLAVSGNAFDSDEFMYEIKWDGIRAMAYCNHHDFWMESRNFKPLLPRFPELATIQHQLSARQIILDGEIVILGDDGKPDFDTVRARNAQKDPLRIAESMRRHPAVFVAFDCLFVDGKSFMRQPLSERVRRLDETITSNERVLQSRPVAQKGIAFYQVIQQQSLEGMVAKKLSSPYQPGHRSPHWIKVRNVQTTHCVIGGWIPKEELRLKSFVLGLFDNDKNLKFMGSVGTGIKSDDEIDILPALRRLGRPTSPFDAVPGDIARSARWVEPTLVCRVEYLTLTREGQLRHPVFKGLATDKDPSKCLHGTKM